MAGKTSTTRNSERRSGKKWGRNHNAPVKALTKEQQERRAHKLAERAKRKTPPVIKGFKYTMPDFDWNWATGTINTRFSSRRLSMVDICLAQRSSKPAADPVVSTLNDAKTPHSRKKDKVSA